LSALHGTSSGNCAFDSAGATETTITDYDYYDSRMTDVAAHLVVVGTVCQTPTADRLQVLTDVVVSVDVAGLILRIDPATSVAGRTAIATATTVRTLSANQRLLPGLIDAHVHAPQWPQLGSGLDLPLEQWLFTNTLPLEARFADAAFAQRVWDDMVPCLLSHGTTTAVYYSSIHEEATLRLARTCAEIGQRAFVGRVAMDHPEGTPEWYRDVNANEALHATERSIDSIRALNNYLVQPVVTPRFVPACTDQLLHGLGELAATSGALVQTHCSESDWEHRYVHKRYGHSDTDALSRFGLLREGTVLAHGNHMSTDDFDRTVEVGAGVAHCPLSNSYFGNAVFPLARALQRGVRVALGTDIAGGCHPGLLPQCVSAVTSSRMLEDGVDPTIASGERGTGGSRIDTVAAFHVATMGGANLLGIPCGLLEAGRMFDAFVVDIGRRQSSLRIWSEVDDDARIFEKIVRLASPDDITSVWVAGRQVSGSSDRVDS
jgi:guanine deaminase